MARFSERDRRWVDVIVDRWRESCLVQDGALLSEGTRVWTLENINELYGAFNEGQLEGEQSFEEKLTTQLGGTEDNTKRLMAEVVVVYFLFASSVGGPRKRELVSFILAMSGDEFPEDEELLKAFSTGIGGPGQAFNSYRPFLLAYLSSFARRFKRIESDEERRTLLADPWKFRGWLVGPSDDADSGEQMMRHLLLHLLFPDEMERIASGSHKWRIAETFDGLLDKPWDETDENLDERLFAIRNRVTDLMPDGQPGVGKVIDFYYPPLREAWDAEQQDAGDDDSGISNLGALEQKKQVVLYGPPGTGKTYEAKDLARRLVRHQALLRWGAVAFLQQRQLVEDIADRQVRRLQLHQGFSYEDFVWGMRVGDGGATVPQEGYLLKLVDEIASTPPPAADLKPLPWVLILDEVNRVDLSRLLGECFSLLEDRDEPVDLSMLDKHGNRRLLRLPADLFVIGTMNLIDQSVEQLDFALRRRFLWIESGFNGDVIPRVVRARWEKLSVSRHHPWSMLEPEIEKLVERAELLNVSVRDSALLGDQYELGHCYYFDVAGFISAWSRVRPKGQRPKGYLWQKTNGEPHPPLLDLWRHSLRPVLAQYLGAIEPQAARAELGKLRDILVYGEA